MIDRICSLLQLGLVALILGPEPAFALSEVPRQGGWGDPEDVYKATQLRENIAVAQ
jgi:hypothetical protein